MARVPNRERGAISTPLVLLRFLKHPRQPHFPNLCPRTLMPPKNIKGLAAARSIVSIPGTEPDASPTAAPLPAGAPKAQRRAPPRRDMVRPSAKKKGKTPITNSVAPAPATTPSATVANVPSHLPESSSSPGIRTLQHDITAVKARIEELQLHEIAPLNHRLTELENVDLTLLNERMDGVEGSETDLDVRMKAMKASMDRSKGADYPSSSHSPHQHLPRPSVQQGLHSGHHIHQLQDPWSSGSHLLRQRYHQPSQGHGGRGYWNGRRSQG
ncbi:hypothetical protein FA13DRAFT_1455740 [Coprinellus micaceus]|uniref:Uncharacterized protein n=1 Tax=Coprinellus micaceus TaxID=71717 RepID=A0A4Y7SMM3_COPMI|nr:hypothetical protein FA13DRAFT_1455740 [Coprinellus micaceus]